jgi:uncharacterized protein
LSLLDEALRAPNCVIGVMGAHAGEDAAAIFSRKISDCRAIGRTFWVAKSAKARPAQVQAICDSSHGYVIFVEPATPGGTRPTKESDSATAYSPDRATWLPLPSGIGPVTGHVHGMRRAEGHVDAPRSHEVSLPSNSGRGATFRAVLRLGQIGWLPLWGDLYNGAMNAQPTKQQVVAKLRALKPELESVYHMKSVALFGSYVRDEQDPESDLDLLVSFKEVPSLLRFIEMEDFLSDSLHLKVDLVMAEALKPNIGRRIRKELVSV